jgi:hypothetical protein
MIVFHTRAFSSVEEAKKFTEDKLAKYDLDFNTHSHSYAVLAPNLQLLNCVEELKTQVLRCQLAADLDEASPEMRAMIFEVEAAATRIYGCLLQKHIVNLNR